MNRRYNYLRIAVIFIMVLFLNVMFLAAYAQDYLGVDTTATDNQKEQVEQKVVEKEPVIMNDEVVLYIGAQDKISAKQRALNIKSAIRKAIEYQAKDSKHTIETDITQESGDYVIAIGKDPVVRVTDIDAEANKLDKDKLAKVWKSNIIEVIKEDLKTMKLKPESSTEIFKDLGILLVVLIVFLFVMEFLRVRISQFISIIAARLVKRFDRFLHKLKEQKEENKEVSVDDQKDLAEEEKEEQESVKITEKDITEDVSEDEPQKDEKEERLEEKIKLITKELNTIVDVIVRFIQVISVLIFVDYVLYEIPETNVYVNNFTHFVLGAFDVIKSSLFSWIGSDNTWESFSRILMIVIVTAVVISALRILGTAIENIISVILEENRGRSKRIQTITKIIRTTLKILIIILALVLILSEVGVNITPIVAGAGIVGLALSFGSQSLVKDIINGIFILIENQFGIGDVVSINDTGGVVEDMTLRVTVLRDLSGKVYIIPNSQITTVVVLTKGWARAHLDIGIAYKEDIDTATRIIQEVANKMKEEFPEKMTADPEILGVNALGDSSVDIKIIMKTNPGDQWFVEREFRRRIKYAFDQNNIEIPFPHTTLYVPQPVGYEKND